MDSRCKSTSWCPRETSRNGCPREARVWVSTAAQHPLLRCRVPRSTLASCRWPMTGHAATVDAPRRDARPIRRSKWGSQGISSQEQCLLLDLKKKQNTELRSSGNVLPQRKPECVAPQPELGFLHSCGGAVGSVAHYCHSEGGRFTAPIATAPAPG